MPRQAAKPSVKPKRRVCARELLARNMVRLRGELGWSQEDLAFEADLHRTFIAHVERQVRNPTCNNQKQ